MNRVEWQRFAVSYRILISLLRTGIPFLLGSFAQRDLIFKGACLSLAPRRKTADITVTHCSEVKIAFIIAHKKIM